METQLGGREFSSYARAVLLDAPIPEPRHAVRTIITQRHMSEFEANKARQLSWIGNNLNQLAKVANTSGASLEIFMALLSLERSARRIAA